MSTCDRKNRSMGILLSARSWMCMEHTGDIIRCLFKNSTSKGRVCVCSSVLLLGKTECLLSGRCITMKSVRGEIFL